MNILTFDIEDWYNCDVISGDMNWNKYEVRIYDGVKRILDELDCRDQKATFFCLGWLAENHPDVIRDIYRRGHQIGCHSYQHELSFRLNRKEFKEDTQRAKSLIEDAIGDSVDLFRAPAFSITKNNMWALETLLELGFKFDCSVFPAHHDYGGMPGYGVAEPVQIQINGGVLKEFPINVHSIFNKNIVFSGGGFFRLFPYFLIKKWALQADYLMTYFHPRDFDPKQPIMKGLPPVRLFKSYVGLKSSFRKLQRFLDDFDFIDIQTADKLIDWNNCRTIKLDNIHESSNLR